MASPGTRHFPGQWPVAGHRWPIPDIQVVAMPVTSAAEREEFLAGVDRRAKRGGRHGGPDARRPGLVQLPARRPADRG